MLFTILVIAAGQSTASQCVPASARGEMASPLAHDFAIAKASTDNAIMYASQSPPSEFTSSCGMTTSLKSRYHTGVDA